MLTAHNPKAVPQPDRPFIAEPEYGIPTSLEGVLPWSHVQARLAQARNYWVGTVSPQARPHVVPVWYEEKYGLRHGPPVWVLQPRLVLAWTEFPANTTRWRFEGQRASDGEKT